jgi:hypothetical protein
MQTNNILEKARIESVIKVRNLTCVFLENSADDDALVNQLLVPNMIVMVRLKNSLTQHSYQNDDIVRVMLFICRHQESRYKLYPQ